MAVPEDILKKLAAAEGNVRAQSVITAEFAISVRPAASRNKLRTTLDAATVLRWFDPQLLGSVLSVDDSEAEERFQSLIDLPFVEHFPGKDERFRNIHDATRLGWRLKLYQENREAFRMLSSRAAEYFAADCSPRGRIERLYHLLGANPGYGAQELENLNRRWSGSTRPEHQQSLALTVSELESNAMVSGRARVEVLLCIANVHSIRGEITNLEKTAGTALEIAREVGYQSGVARALALFGDAARGQKTLQIASSAFEEYYSLSKSLSEGWQREWAVANIKLGGVSQAQGDFPTALSKFDEAVVIFTRLLEADPNNTDWERHLAVTQSRIGDVLEAQGRFTEALAAFTEHLNITSRLSKDDPSNLACKREVGAAHIKIGDIFKTQGNLATAFSSFERSVAIFREIVEEDSSNAARQQDLAIAHSRIGGVFEAQKNYPAALVEFTEYLDIVRELCDTDPFNLIRQRELAVAHSRIGDVFRAQQNLAAASTAYAEDLTISRRLAGSDRANIAWQRDVAVTLIKLYQCEDTPTGLVRLHEAEQILSAVVAKAPNHVIWNNELGQVRELIAAADGKLSEEIAPVTETQRIQGF